MVGSQGTHAETFHARHSRLGSQTIGNTDTMQRRWRTRASKRKVLQVKTKDDIAREIQNAIARRRKAKLRKKIRDAVREIDRHIGVEPDALCTGLVLHRIRTDIKGFLNE